LHQRLKFNHFKVEMRNIFFAFLIGIIINAHAQRGRMKSSPEEKTGKFIQHWTTELKLSVDQQAKAKPVVLEMFTKIDNLKIDTTLNKPSRGNAMKEARRSGIEKFKALLTSDQAAIFTQKMKEMNHRQEKGKPGGKENKGSKKAAKEEVDNDDIF